MNHPFLSNEHPIIDPTTAYATHFGVVSDSDQDPEIVFVPTEPPHNDPSTETILWRAPHVTAFVSGRWTRWGPADQEESGDKSLHVLVYTPKMPDNALLNDLREALCSDVADGHGRVIDYAYLGSAANWGLLYEVITFVGGIARFPVTAGNHGFDSVDAEYSPSQEKQGL